MSQFKIYIIFGLLFCMAGCAVTPEDLGISQQQWAKYSENEQQRILAEHKSVSAAKRKAPRAEAGDNWLQVSIKDGLVKMPPFTRRYKYIPVTFRIKLGTCQKILLHTYNGAHSVKLDCCYKDNVLLLDPSRYKIDKWDGSIRLYYSPLWKNGFIYKKINSDGYVYLYDVTIKIKQETAE